jgi:TPP-dependent pyruvate/acetoin dehydrogenase alpha subunit
MVQQHAAKIPASRFLLAIGDEAVVVAPSAELTPEDTVTCDGSNLAALVARGLSLDCLLADSERTTPSQCGGRSSITSASLPEDPFNLATGLALAHQLNRKQRVVVAFCPSESPTLETWHEALKFAGVHKLPVIFVIKNGVADQQSSNDHAPHLEAFSFMARDYGYPGIIADGQDVVAVWRVAQESIHRARIGSGPTLIDCRTDPGRDPLAYMEHYMRKRKVWDDAWKHGMEEHIGSELQKAGARLLITP